MIALLEAGLKAGALGMSSGLFTPPGSYAQPDEMEAFGHVLKRHNAGYFTHLRDESNKVLDAVHRSRSTSPTNAASMSRSCISNARAPTIGAKARQALQMIADAKARGLDVDCDAYPLCRRLQPAEEPAAAMGAVRRRAGDAGTAQAAGDAPEKSAPTSSATA